MTTDEARRIVSAAYPDAVCHEKYSRWWQVKATGLGVILVKPTPHDAWVHVAEWLVDRDFAQGQMISLRAQMKAQTSY